MWIFIFERNITSIEYSIYLGFVKCKTRAVLNEELTINIHLYDPLVSRSLRLKEMNINSHSNQRLARGFLTFPLFVCLFLPFISFFWELNETERPKIERLKDWFVYFMLAPCSLEDTTPTDTFPQWKCGLIWSRILFF